MKVYQAIASGLDAAQLCEANGNAEWYEKHVARVATLVRDFLPSGSGFDAGTQFDIEKHIGGKLDKLTFTTAFHHMDEHGGYDGWTEHKVIIRPSFEFGFDITVTGRQRNDIKDYIADVFAVALKMESN